MTAPLLRRLTAGLLILPLLFGAGCSDDKTEKPSLTLSAEKIVLPSEAGATARLDVTASGPWQLEISGSGFDASPLHGGRGTTSVTLTATETNTSTARTSLGSLHLFMPQSGPELTVSVEQRPAVAAQTLLLYMPGRSLASYFEQNIEGIRRAVDADTPGDGRIFVCWQPANQRTAELFELYYDPNSASCATREVKTYTEFNAGDPESVHTLFAELADEAPALSYGLIIGCHGKAWVPASAGTLARGALQPSDGAKEYWQPAPGAYPTRSFGDSGYEMDITELADALAALPYRFDFLLFDDCFMANIETLYDLRASVDHVIASPCEIMADGFPYDRIIPQMFTDEGRSHDLGAVCYEFWNLYQNDYASTIYRMQSGCITLAVMSEIDRLADVMRRINRTPAAEYDPNTLQTYEGLSPHLFYDMGQYVSVRCSERGAARRVRGVLRRSLPAREPAAHRRFLFGLQQPDEPHHPLFGHHDQRAFDEIHGREPRDKLVPRDARIALHPQNRGGQKRMKPAGPETTFWTPPADPAPASAERESPDGTVPLQVLPSGDFPYVPVCSGDTAGRHAAIGAQPRTRARGLATGPAPCATRIVRT